MQYDNHNQTTYYNESLANMAINAGLRSFMIGVYNNMAMGLIVSALSAMFIYNMSVTTSSAEAAVWLRSFGLTSFGYTLFASKLRFVVIFSPLVFILIMNAVSDKMSVAGARLMFLAFAAIMGVSLSTVLMVYTHSSVTQTFFTTAAAFGSLSLWAYTTKKDMSGWGSFLFMGLIGLIIAMIVNLFLASSAMQFAISGAGVLIFAGLTAYDTQKLKTMYLYGNFNPEQAARVAIYGALNLYLDFINMFQFLLYFMGSSRD